MKVTCNPNKIGFRDNLKKDFIFKLLVPVGLELFFLIYIAEEIVMNRPKIAMIRPMMDHIEWDVIPKICFNAGKIVTNNGSKYVPTPIKVGKSKITILL